MSERAEDNEHWRRAAVVDRITGYDWRAPKSDVARLKAAYQRWQAMLGLERPVTVIADPMEAFASDWCGRDDSAHLDVSDVWPVLARRPFARSMWAAISPATAPAPLPAAWDAASVWAYAFTQSLSLRGEHLSHLHEEDFKSAWAAVRCFAGGDRARLCATALLGMPLLGLLDPPPAIASLVRDLLVASRHDLVWRHLVDENQEAHLAEVLGIDMRRLDPTVRREEVLDALVAVSEPMIEASMNGAFAHAFVGNELVVLTSPRIWTDGGCLHRRGGPAIAWRETKVYAWNGWIMPPHIVRTLAMSPADERGVRKR